LTRALSKDLDGRFPTAAAFREELEAVARGEGEGHGRVLRTLAVLPFENLSGDDSQEFFADGMTEAITAAIARLGSIRVISRTSAMQFKRERPLIPEIARRLNADAVVEGSVIRAGDRVRISAQLVDARRDQHLWAESLDRDLTDVLDLQAEVARAIVKGIHSRLVAPEVSGERPTVPPRERRRAVDPEAYVEYLRGRYAWTKRTPEAVRQAIAHYEGALERDPTYASAYAGIAECYDVLGRLGSNNLLVVPSRSAWSAHDQLGFVQASDFQYLTGREHEVGAVLLLDGANREVHLFVNRSHPRIRRWTIQPGRDAAQQFGLTTVMPVDSLASWLERRLRGGGTLYVAPTDNRGAVSAPLPMANSVARWQAFLGPLGAGREVYGVSTKTNFDSALAEIRPDPGPPDFARQARGRRTAWP
jgi:TolB-like protein